MSDHGNGLGRRGFVRSATAGGLSLAAFSGLSSAEGVETFGVGSLTLEGGLIDNSQQYAINADIGADIRRKIRSRGEQIVTEVDFQKGIGALNQAKQKGHVEFTEEDGVVQVGLTDAGRQAAETVLEQINGRFGTHDHGINDYETNAISVPPNIKAWTDDPTTEAIVIGTATTAALLAAWGVQGPAPAAIAGIILGLAAQIISTANDGHGVRFTFYVTPVPPFPPVTPTITPQ